MRTSALFGAKNFIFSKFMLCLSGQGGGVEPVRTICEQGKGHFFAASFVDGA